MSYACFAEAVDVNQEVLHEVDHITRKETYCDNKSLTVNALFAAFKDEKEHSYCEYAELETCKDQTPSIDAVTRGAGARAVDGGLLKLKV